MIGKKCQVCGIVLPEDARFCFKCGAKISEERGRVIVCEICGFENEPKSKFCHSCGSKLNVKDISFDKEEVHQTPSYKMPEEDFIKEEKEKFRPKDKAKKKKRTIRLSFYSAFYLVIALVFVGLIIYALVHRKDVKHETHQHVNLNTEIMTEIENLRQRVNSNPDDMASTLKLANLLHDVHIFEQAIEYYRRYLERNESDPDARVDMGICLFEIGSVDEAIREIEKALSYSPNHQLALYNLGVINLSSGNLEKAKTYFMRCIEVDPSTSVAQKARQMIEQHKF